MLSLWRDRRSADHDRRPRRGRRALLEHDPGALMVAESSGRVVGTVIAAWDGWRGSVYRVRGLAGPPTPGVRPSLVGRGREPSCGRRGHATCRPIVVGTARRPPGSGRPRTRSAKTPDAFTPGIHARPASPRASAFPQRPRRPPWPGRTPSAPGGEHSLARAPEPDTRSIGGVVREVEGDVGPGTEDGTVMPPVGQAGTSSRGTAALRVRRKASPARSAGLHGARRPDSAGTAARAVPSPAILVATATGSAVRPRSRQTRPQWARPARPREHRAALGGQEPHRQRPRRDIGGRQGAGGTGATAAPRTSRRRPAGRGTPPWWRARRARRCSPGRSARPSRRRRGARQGPRPRLPARSGRRGRSRTPPRPAPPTPRSGRRGSGSLAARAPRRSPGPTRNGPPRRPARGRPHLEPEAPARGPPAAPPHRPRNRRSARAAARASREWGRSPSRRRRPTACAPGPGRRCVRPPDRNCPPSATNRRLVAFGDLFRGSGVGRCVVHNDTGQAGDGMEQAVELRRPAPHRDHDRDVVGPERCGRRGRGAYCPTRRAPARQQPRPCWGPTGWPSRHRSM